MDLVVVELVDHVDIQIVQVAVDHVELDERLAVALVVAERRIVVEKVVGRAIDAKWIKSGGHVHE